MEGLVEEGLHQVVDGTTSMEPIAASNLWVSIVVDLPSSMYDLKDLVHVLVTPFV